MNRFLIAIAMAALLTQAVAAQDQGEPSESGALEAAQPLVIAFVPGLSAPFAPSDAAISLGLIGVATRDVEGFQMAGVFGLARNIEGFQGTGVFGIAEGDVEGFQGAGVFNIAGGRVEGFQGAGVFNVAGGDVESFQAAGVFNIAEGRVDGFQVAGVFNQAGRVDGCQIAGVFNIAGDVEGIQIGLVNIADRVDGMQLGLINIAREPGLNSFGVFYEPETEYVYAAFQGGSRRFYNVFSAGKPRNDWGRSDEDGLVLSYGFGSRIGELSGSYLDLDLSAATFIGPELPAIGEAIRTGHALADASALVPYPSLRLCLGVPILGKLHLVGGLKVDVDLDASPRVPEALKRGQPWTSELFGAGFKAWTKWYLGVKI